MTSVTPDVYQQLVAQKNKEIEQKTFKMDKLSTYIQQAEDYAGNDSSLLERLVKVLNSIDFQTDQIKFLKKWDNNLIINQTCESPHEVLHTTLKVDRAFDFFKENFYWT